MAALAAVPVPAASLSTSWLGAPVRGFHSLTVPTNYVKLQRSTIVWRPLSITADLKRWERKDVKENSLPVRQTMHVKIGDTVQIISGADKKKVGEVVRIFTHNSKILIKNINLKTKHVKGKSKEESGQIIQVEAPIHSSNVMLYSKDKKVASRVGHKTLEDGRKVRFLIKTGEVIDKPDDWKKIYKKEKKDKK